MIEKRRISMTQTVHNGWFSLHDMRVFDWEKWKQASEETRIQAIDELNQLLQRWDQIEEKRDGSHALYSIVGQKADLMFVIFRPTTIELKQAEIELAKTRFADFTKPAFSYLATVEKSSFSQLPGASDPEMIKKLNPMVPKTAHICFYPMSKRRGEQHNWFRLPIEERKRMMLEHVETCKKYTNTVKRIITGSAGLDDYEWGISLFSDDAHDFKKIIYDTRFDEVSAVYGVFGSFYIGNRMENEDFGDLFSL